MTLQSMPAMIGIVSTIVAGTVAIETRYAHDSDFQQVSSKQEFIEDLQIEQLVSRLVRLRKIRNPSPDILSEIDDTREDLERLRKVREQR